MNVFADAIEIDQIRSDMRELIQSPEAMLVTLRWKVYSDPQDSVYPDHDTDSGTDQTASVQVYFIPMEPRVMLEDHGGIMPGDAIFLLDKDLDIAGRENMVIETPEGARYVLEANPPQVFYHYTAVTLGGETPVQYVYARLQA